MPPRKPKDVGTTREKELVAEIKDLTDFYSISQAKAPSAAVQAKAQIARLQAELYRIRKGREIDSLTDPIARLRAQAVVASEEGSWVAAEKFATSAARLELEAAHARSLAASEALDGASPDDLASVIVEAIPGLPRLVQAQIVLDLLSALALTVPDDLEEILEAEANAGVE